MRHLVALAGFGVPSCRECRGVHAPPRMLVLSDLVLLPRHLARSTPDRCHFRIAWAVSYSANLSAEVAGSGLMIVAYRSRRATSADKTAIAANTATTIVLAKNSQSRT